MPSTSNLSDCRKIRIDCISVVAGPRASWSTMTLIFCACSSLVIASVRTEISRTNKVRCFIVKYPSQVLEIHLSEKKALVQSSSSQTSDKNFRYPNQSGSLPAVGPVSTYRSGSRSVYPRIPRPDRDSHSCSEFHAL